MAINTAGQSEHKNFFMDRLNKCVTMGFTGLSASTVLGEVHGGNFDREILRLKDQNKDDVP